MTEKKKKVQKNAENVVFVRLDDEPYQWLLSLIKTPSPKDSGEVTMTSVLNKLLLRNKNDILRWRKVAAAKKKEAPAAEAV